MSEESNAMTADELSELDELLASVDESAEPMDASEADGFMTAIQLLPTLPDTRSWLGQILSTNGKASASTGSAAEDKRLRELLIKRFRGIGETLANSQPLDPIYFDAEDEQGRVLEGKEALKALEPFAMGFLEAGQIWSDFLEKSDSPKIAQALHGILRHLPQGSLGDFAETKQILDKEAPLEDLPAALSDLASCVAEIANVTKGYAFPELNEPMEEERKN